MEAEQQRNWCSSPREVFVNRWRVMPPQRPSKATVSQKWREVRADTDPKYKRVRDRCFQKGLSEVVSAGYRLLYCLDWGACQAAQ